MKSGPLTHILSCTTSSGMWSNLKSVYYKESAVSVHLLQQKFFLIEFKEDSVATLMSKLEEIRVNLKQAREQISDKMLITKVVKSLPEHMGSLPLETQSVQELTSRLLVEDERICSRDEEVITLVSVSSSSSSSRKCYNCGKDGRLDRFCDKNKEKIIGHYCKKICHLIANCRKLKAKNFNREN
ncbi:hypothetical protein PR048_026139 [Dryococelus australis]|uniref:CCHC-type domain-containing protein n=1 Tax=Dryococelus australis TaxID=614101 RepID=A0ABQ9GKI6_9NEOP|nr:hypothetical protein PR048_026139 [Dryococelus australis]